MYSQKGCIKGPSFSFTFFWHGGASIETLAPKKPTPQISERIPSLFTMHGKVSNVGSIFSLLNYIPLDSLELERPVLPAHQESSAPSGLYKKIEYIHNFVF